MPVFKIMSRKKLYSIENSIRYILRDGSRNYNQTPIEPMVYNIRSDPSQIKDVVHEFMVNESYRKVTTDRVFCYHSIISLSVKDKSQCTPKMLQALMDHYIEQRGDILAYGAIHLNTDAPHIHIIESGTRYREDKSSRMCQAELTRIKLELERFVEIELKLEHSKVEHKSGQYRTTERTSIDDLFQNRNLSKKEIAKEVEDILYRSESKQDFIDALFEHGYTYYERSKNGIPTGIIDKKGRKHRFKTLNISPQTILDLEGEVLRTKETELLDKLQRIRDTRNQEPIKQIRR